MTSVSNEKSAVWNAFLEINRELTALRSIQSTLSWDQETTMPPAGAPFRARQVATIASLCHQKLTAPAYGELLDRLETLEIDDPWDEASLREARREYDRAARVPESLVKELAETCSLSYMAWVEAREKSDFGHFAPWLEKVIQLKRQQAKCLTHNGDVPFDAMLDEYEPGMTMRRLDPLLAILRPGLTALLERIEDSSHQPDPSLLQGRFPQSEQIELGKAVVTAMGFDWQAGRLDLSPHPFCSGLNPGDVRITARYREDDFSVGFFGIIHEAGHGLYEQGLDRETYGRPVQDTVSLGIHESQSRLWEIFVARGRPFWEHWYPRLQAAFPENFQRTPLDKFLHAVNRVEASHIRVDADEVTYGLHIILRYEIEKALFEGGLEADDLEAVWNEKMDEYLGLTPPDAARGVLQDVHWAHGLMGYFPTYLLGTLYANQLFDQAGKDLPQLDAQLARGEMSALTRWLRENVHQAGKRWRADELIRRVTGKSIDPESFLDYLNKKYELLYKLK